MDTYEPKSGGCGRWLAGCGIAVVVGLGLIVLFGYLMTAPFRQAVDAERKLAARASSAPFTPAPDGSIAADRVQAFLVVRSALAGPCRGIADFDETLRRMDDLDQRNDVSRTEALKLALSTTKAAMGMARKLGTFFATRDRALLDAGMGLDEYDWIYVLAYHGQLLEPRERDERRAFHDTVLSGRVAEGLHGVLERQRAALAAAGGSPEQLAALDAELEAMAADPHRLPWQDGLPDAVAASLAPFREQLDQAFCRSAVGIELKTNKAHAGGFTIETN
jgi:hypothetical protein